MKYEGLPENEINDSAVTGIFVEATVSFFLSVWENNDGVTVYDVSGNLVGTTPSVCLQLINRLRRQMNECKTEIDTAVNSRIQLDFDYGTTETSTTKERIVTEFVSASNINR